MTDERREFFDDVERHKEAFADNMQKVIDKLEYEKIHHDESKYDNEEKDGYFELFLSIKGTKYGTPERKAAIDKAKTTIDHHYQENDHHPEHFENGIDDMDLVQVVKLVIDWKGSCDARGEDLRETADINRKRFNISPQLWKIINNTIRMLYEE